MSKLLFAGIFLSLSSFCFSQNQNLILSPAPVDGSDVWEAPAAENSMTIGHCSDVIENEVGFRPNKLVEGGIQFTEDMLVSLKGNTLTKVLLGIGRDLGRENKLMLTYDLDGEPFYVQDVYSDELKASAWNTIELETPYVIKGEEFFIIYHAKGSNRPDCYIFGLDNTLASEYGGWMRYEEDGGFSSWFWVGEGNFYTNFCMKGVVEGDNLPQYDLSMKSVSMDEYVAPGRAFSVEGVLNNVAAATVPSFDIEVKIGDNEPVSKTFNNVDLSNGDNYSFAIDGLVIDEVGEYDVAVSVVLPEATADENDANNTMVKQIKCTDEFYQRNVLLERFTTADCTNCPTADYLIDAAIEDYGLENRVIKVSHHAGYSVLNDNFQIPESVQYTMFYNGSQYAPALMLDRTNLGEYGAPQAGGAESPGPVFFPGDDAKFRELLQLRANELAYVQLEIEKMFDNNSRELKLRINGTASRDDIVDNADLKLTVFLLENNLKAYQAGASDPQNYIHNEVIRDVVSDVWGDPVEFDNYKFSKEYTYNVSMEWISSNMTVVAFLYNKDGEGTDFDVNNCGVLNAASYKLGDPNNLSVEVVDEHAMSFIVNGNTVKSDKVCDSIDVYGLDGTLTAQYVHVDSFMLESGFHIVKFTVDGKEQVEKILIK